MFDLQLLLWSTLHLILILANPLPQSSPEVDSLLTEDFTASNEIECTTSNDQNQDIFRRGATICPITTQDTIPMDTPQRPPVRTLGDYNPCRAFKNEYKKPVTCGGPEIHIDNELRWVLNCISGLKSQIPAQGFWPPILSPARYCCKRYVYRSPYFMAGRCVKITPDVPILQWNEDQYEEFRIQRSRGQSREDSDMD